jgi:hypothetical protein
MLATVYGASSFFYGSPALIPLGVQVAGPANREFTCEFFDDY